MHRAVSTLGTDRGAGFAEKKSNAPRLDQSAKDRQRQTFVVCLGGHVKPDGERGLSGQRAVPFTVLVDEPSQWQLEGNQCQRCVDRGA